jgi:hypothetical protein
MPSSDDRKLTTGIAVKVPASGKQGKQAGRKITHVQRVFTDADDYEEIECHLTPDEVERLKEVDPATGVPVLVGDWTGRATRKVVKDPETGEDVHGPVIPAEYEHKDEEGKPRKRGRPHKKEE